MAISDSLNNAVTSTVNFSSIGSTITWIAIILFILMVFGVIFYFVVLFLKYNKKIVILEDIAGRGYVPTGKDRATLVKIGDSGEEVLKLYKRKVYRTAYGKKIGKNTYAFAIGNDGYWYNITFGDVNKELAELQIKPVDKDMRYMHVAIRRNIANRYDKVSFWDKYGTQITFIIFVVVVGVMFWLILDKFNEVGGAMAGSMEAVKEVNEASAKIIGSLDNLQSGGSGIVQVDGG